MSASPFEQSLRTAINIHSRENATNTPDVVLARYLLRCLDAYDAAAAADRPRLNAVSPRYISRILDAYDEAIAERARLTGPPPTATTRDETA